MFTLKVSEHTVLIRKYGCKSDDLRNLHSEDIYLTTHSLIPWSTVLLEKLTGFQQVKKFPAFYGTRKFITVFTSARHLSLSKVSVQVRGLMYEWFVTRYVFTARSYHQAQPPSWRTTPCRMSATAYSIYSQLPSILEAVPPWERAMPWWQGGGTYPLFVY
jgi:hypothetical protein